MAVAGQEVFLIYLNYTENLLHCEVSESSWLVVCLITENRLDRSGILYQQRSQEGVSKRIQRGTTVFERCEDLVVLKHKVMTMKN